MKISRILSDNLPTILTSVAAVGTISTAVLAVKATPLAYRDIMDAQSEFVEPITNLDKVKLTWQYYVPAALMGTITISAIIGINAVSSKRQAAIAGLYTLTDKAFNEYKDKVVEVIGEKEEEKVRHEVAKDQMEANPPVKSEIIFTGDGTQLCYDAVNSRYFESDMQVIRSAVNDINEKIINEMYATQNDFYSRLGVDLVKYGDEIGWTSDRMLEVDYSAQLTPDGKPCISIGYQMETLRPNPHKPSSWM